MSILRKPLGEITVEDLQHLVDVAALESRELEFKGTLPFQPQKGHPQTADRWIEKGDRIGDYARDEILAEIVAFANADGGTLVLGLHETKDEPRRADRLEPLPNCIGLARRLIDASEDIVEPRLRAFDARGLETDANGNGYVVMRVGKSAGGPHRLRSTREFHIRRGERASKMDVREIKDITLELARTGDRVERVFRERQAATAASFSRLLSGESQNGTDPLVIRVTALPVLSQEISNLTSQTDLWWQGNGFTMLVGNEKYECGYPAREFNEQPEIRLRSLVLDHDVGRRAIERLLRADGLVEFGMVLPKEPPYQGSATHSRIYIGWIIGLVVGTIAQVNKLQTKLAWDGIEFGLEIEIEASPPLVIKWNDRQFHSASVVKADFPLRLPRYSIIAGMDFDTIIQAVVSDLFNATGRAWDRPCKVPWAKLLS